MSALSRTATGDTSKKKQRIHTPRSILEPLARLWPDGIGLDPCGSPDSLVDAHVTYGPEFEIADGLEVAWEADAFINPPYRYLKEWMRHGMAQRNAQIWLVPVRPHRKWWREFLESCDAMIWLDPLKFDGYAQSFPAPLALFMRNTNRGPETPYWDMLGPFREHFSHLGGFEDLRA